MKHVGLLPDFMKDHYGSIARRFQVLFKQREISFDLLWVLYKPNSLIYTTCPGTGKPRCVRFISAEVKTSVHKGKYLNMECRYLHNDSKRFGEATIDLDISEFSWVQKINNLSAFPLRFHKDEEAVRSQLIECGRKFVSLQGLHHRHYHGEAFYMRKGVPIKLHVSSRVMVDAVSLKEANPNYSIPKIQESSDGVHDFAILTWEDLSSTASQSTVERTLSAQDIQHEDLLICSPTVLGYSLQDKLWRTEINLPFRNGVVSDTLNIVEFAVAELKSIEWDSMPFESLELKPERKMLIQALAESVGPGQDGISMTLCGGKAKELFFSCSTVNYQLVR